MYDYGARFYDPSLSLWNSVDPLTAKYPGISAYVYTFNNPIMFNDPTGMEGEGVDGIIVGENGKELANDGINDDRVYVTNEGTSYETIKFIKKNSGKSEVLNSSFKNSNVTEIESLESTRQAMVNAVSGDNGKGGTADDNNREYGGSIMSDGSVKVGDPGPVTTPSEGAVFSNYQPSDKSRFHSRPSGTVDEGGELGTFGGTTTLGSTSETGYGQRPSPTDEKNAGSQTRYVFAKGDGTVYIYNNKGVQATLPIKSFAKLKLRKK